MVTNACFDVKRKKKQQQLSYMNFYVKRPSAVMREWEKSYPKSKVNLRLRGNQNQICPLLK